jgi:hypothetical protein
VLHAVEQYDGEQIPVLGPQRRVPCLRRSVDVGAEELESQLVGQSDEYGPGLLAQAAPGPRQQLNALIPRSLRSCPPMTLHGSEYPVPYC